MWNRWVDPGIYPTDFDGDGLCDIIDHDDDNDGWLDSTEQIVAQIISIPKVCHKIPMEIYFAILLIMMMMVTCGAIMMKLVALRTHYRPHPYQQILILMVYDFLDDDDDNDGYPDDIDEAPLDPTDHRF